MICIEYYFRKATIDDFDFIFDLKKKNFKKYIEEYFEWNMEKMNHTIRWKNVELNILLLISIKMSRVGGKAIFLMLYIYI